MRRGVVSSETKDGLSFTGVDVKCAFVPSKIWDFFMFILKEIGAVSQKKVLHMREVIYNNNTMEQAIHK